MKKIWKILLTVGCVATLSVNLVACNNKLSAYDIAVKNGFVGTEQEWLLSLHGENGKDGEDLDVQELYEAAVKSGYTGSYLEFCATLDISVPQYNDTVQIAENILSIVSINCGYSVTEQVSSGGLFSRPVMKKNWYTSVGSGVIVDLNKEGGNAYIVTNYHVVYNIESDQRGLLDEIWIYPYGAYNRFNPQEGDKYGDGIKATYVGGAMDYDIAVLKVEGSEYLKNSAVTEAKMGNSNDLTVGEETYVIGNAAGAGISVTNGILSVQSEYINMYALDNRDEDMDGYVDKIPYRVMRTSAAINGGNSGGGIFNTAGELIGIVNAKYADGTTDNMGYALPITQVQAIYENILANGKEVRQAKFGIIVTTKSSKAVVDEDGNVQVVEEFCVSTEASKGSAAYKKLSTGDIFLSAAIGEETPTVFTRQYQLTEFLLRVRKGDTVRVTVRNTSGEVKTISILFDKEDYFLSPA